MRRPCLLLSLTLLLPPFDASAGSAQNLLDALEPPTWLEALSFELERAEYRFMPAAAGTWSAPNRAQGLRGHIVGDVLVVEPREADGASWTLRLGTRAFGRSGRLVALEAPLVVANHERIELRRGGLLEWIGNDPRGFEQGWTVPAPPPGDARVPLAIELELSGLAAHIDADGRALSLCEADGETRLRYHGLRAWDADGRELEARLVARTGSIFVEVDAAAARYPVEIDPLLSGPVWLASGGQSGAYFGFSVAGAGDVDGDGFDDILVGAPGYDAGALDTGALFLFRGSAAGPSWVPDWSFFGAQAGAQLGASVAGAGDVNGDGFDDFVVGAPRHNAGQVDQGRALLFLGSASGPGPTPDWYAEVAQAGALFGTSVAGAGDVDGDGFDDILIGARGYSGSLANEGGAFLYRGSPTGPSAHANWTGRGGQAGARMGWSVAGAGDVNGDGIDDIVVGVPHHSGGHTSEGRAVLYLGSAAGPSATPDWSAHGGQTAALFGISVAGAGDVNADGFDDVLVGALWYTAEAQNDGAAFLFFGSSAGPSAAPDWSAAGQQAWAGFGGSVAGAGDIDADGFDDLVVGAARFDGAATDEGAVFVFRGSPIGPSAAPDWSVRGQQSQANYGISVARAGDVNGDGIDDLLAGGDRFDLDAVNDGLAILYFGRATRMTIHCVCDGSATAPPCANPGGPFRGCAGSSGPGCLLWAGGHPSLTRDTLTLFATGARPLQLGVFFQGDQSLTGGHGHAFGDGLRCAGGVLLRIETLLCDAAGAASTSHSISERGDLLPGETRHYQFWYKDPAPSPCGTGFNTSNALEVRWGS